jgi:addiction module HigA family antidote
MAMHNPPHPGAILKEDVLPELGLSVTEAARQLGVSRVALSRVLHGKAAISADMALRLEAWIDGPTAETWVRMQADYDLWQARQRPAHKVQRVAVLPDRSTPWTWNTCFAMSKPIVVAFIVDSSSSSSGWLHLHFGTSRCRYGGEEPIPLSYGPATPC